MLKCHLKGKTCRKLAKGLKFYDLKKKLTPGVALTWPWGYIHVYYHSSQTRIVRGSDYSPASELFARERQTMTGNNAKLDLVNVDAHKKIGQILTICS